MWIYNTCFSTPKEVLRMLMGVPPADELRSGPLGLLRPLPLWAIKMQCRWVREGGEIYGRLSAGARMMLIARRRRPMLRSHCGSSRTCSTIAKDGGGGAGWLAGAVLGAFCLIAGCAEKVTQSTHFS